MVRVTNTSAAPRYVHVFLIDSDWNIRQVMNRESNVRLGCTTDTSGTGAILAARESRDCELIRYGRAGGTEDPNVANVSGYSVLVLSTPARPACRRPPSTISATSTIPRPGATRGSLTGGFTFDDELTGEASTRRGTPAPAPPTIAIVDWQLDQSARK